MEPKFQTSFIPKKQIDTVSSGGAIVTETNIFTIAATIIFLVTVLLLGGLFLYKTWLVKEIAKAGADLKSAEAAIDPDRIKELLDADARMTATIGLLEKHLATSNLLHLLNDSTIKKLKYTDFTYRNEGGVPSINIIGEVESYNALAFQQSVLEKNELLKDMNFSDISLVELGNVKFSFKARLDPSLVSFKKLIESGGTEE